MADFKVTELDPDTDFSKLEYWDVVIIGAGPGGLAASLTTAHRGLTTLVIEAKSEPGGQPQRAHQRARQRGPEARQTTTQLPAAGSTR